MQCRCNIDATTTTRSFDSMFRRGGNRGLCHDIHNVKHACSRVPCVVAAACRDSSMRSVPTASLACMSVRMSIHVAMHMTPGVLRRARCERRWQVDARRATRGAASGGWPHRGTGRMSIHIVMYMNITSILTCLFTCLFTRVFFTCLFTCVFTCLSYVYSHLYSHVYAYVDVHVCAHVYARVYAHVFSYIYSHVYTCLYTCPHMCLYMMEQIDGLLKQCDTDGDGMVWTRV